MNRIQNLLEDVESCPFDAPPAALAMPVETRQENPHCLFTPQHYERNYAYPLICWLHGPCDDERQLNRILPLISLRNYVAVGPRGTIECPQGGFAWSQQAEHVALAEQRVFRGITIARQWLNVAPHRVYLAGYDCGGTMALRLALRHPGVFAGVLSIGGGLPTTERPLARWQELRGTNVFLATGSQSRNYPERDVCRDLRMFHTSSMCVNLRQYPCGDEVTTEMLADMDRWIMEQVSAEVTIASSQHSHRS